MENKNSNKKATLELGTRPVGSLLFQYAMPAIVAMTASSLYNIIDRAFIGHEVGPIGISGLAITFPFMNLSGAFGAAVGIGSSTAISVKLGQKDYKTAEALLGNTVTLNLIIGFVFSIVCLVFLDPILRFFGASDQTIPYARSFMQIILAGNMITHMYFGLNAVLRSVSKPQQAMYATIFTVIMNIVLDVVFIKWWHWGIRGAALATIISQTLALLYQFKLFANKQEMLHLKRGIYRLKSNLVKNIIGIGISPFLMNVCTCVVVIFMNGSFGIANAIGTVFLMIIVGLNQGMQPIAGYNYGSQQIDRLLRVLNLTIISAVCVMTAGWLLAMLIPHYCASIFTDNETLIKMSTRAIRIDMFLFPLVGFQMVITNFFQCIGKVKVSIFLSLSRQLLFLLPLLYVLPMFYDVDGVWYSLPASDFVAAVVAGVMMVVYMRIFKKQTNTYSHE